MPGYANPQNLNRYSYVTNNPLRYTDPTGHMLSENEFGGSKGGCSNPKYCNNGQPKSTEELAKMRKEKSKKDKEDEKTPIINPIDTYCGDTSGLACASMFTQDAATLIDLVGVGLIEGPLVVEGCLAGGPVGCAAGGFVAWGIWNTTLNNVETAASGASLVLTVADDLLNNGGWGENSATSLTTFLAGLIHLTPSWDLVVDSYSSGYNHGFFNGAYTFGSNGFLKP